MDHTHNDDYDNSDKLKAYCRVCEFKHHISYMGKAKQIGLNEVNNTGTSNGLWKQILKYEKKYN